MNERADVLLCVSFSSGLHPILAYFLQKARLRQLQVLFAMMLPGSEVSAVLSPYFSGGLRCRVIWPMWIPLWGSHASVLIQVVLVSQLSAVVSGRRAAIISLGQWWKIDALMN